MQRKAAADGFATTVTEADATRNFLLRRDLTGSCITDPTFGYDPDRGRCFNIALTCDRERPDPPWGVPSTEMFAAVGAKHWSRGEYTSFRADSDLEVREC